MGLISKLTLITALWSLNPSNAQTAAPKKPNIIFLFLDDLGFSDIGYNGATYPTPLFDEWATTDAIKLNFHYSESTCSPSRSSLYTGRYSFKSGLSKNVDQETHYHFDPSLTLYPELLKGAGYNTLIVGKWDVGYKYASLLPPARGFDEGLYPHNWRPFQSTAYGWVLDKYDDKFPTTQNRVLINRAANFPKGKLPHCDFWKIVDGQEVPTLCDDDTYTERLYTIKVNEFLQNQTENGPPFYIHYNLVTPHSPLIEPPDLSGDIEYNYTICDIQTLSADKQMFCRSMLYAQERISKIIKKVKFRNLWADTLVVVVSDNGGDPEQSNGVAEGQNLPLRGLKTGINEGGIRTPAFMFGGWWDALMAELNAPSECVYNKLVHISDWYHILTDIAGISHNEADVDHANLQIWQDILCECNSTCNSETDSSQSRTEIIAMRMCGNESKYTSDVYPEKTFYATYIIKDGWKLVINASITFTDDCPNNPLLVGSWQDRSVYTGYDDGEQYITPNQAFYDKWYKPHIDAGRGALYGSQCLDSLAGTADINDPNYAPFQYEEFMLYHIETDKIEACNVASVYPEKVAELWDIIQERSKEYTPPQNMPASPGAMFRKITTYDCTTGYTYLVPWEGLMESECGPVEDTYDSIDTRECNKIWRELNARVSNCVGARGVLEGLFNGNGEDDTIKRIVVFGLVGLIVIAVIGLAFFLWRMRQKKLQKEIENAVKTPLSPKDGQKKQGGGQENVVANASAPGGFTYAEHFAAAAGNNETNTNPQQETQQQQQPQIAGDVVVNLETR